METKNNELQADETCKKERTDWSTLENISVLINFMSNPVRRTDINRHMREQVSTKFGDGMFELLKKKLIPIIGEIQNKETKLYHVTDVTTAIELYKLHLEAKKADMEIKDSVNELKTENKELKEIVDPSRRGARPGYRKETWRNIMVIIDIITKAGGLIKIDELINRYKRQNKQVSFNVSKLDQYSSIMEELGVPFDFSHSKRIGLKVTNCKMLIASKFNEAKGGTGTAEDITKIKKIDSLSKALNILTPELRKATVMNIAKIMYFTRGVQGIKFEDIPSVYKKNYLKDISMDLVMGAISELRQKLDENEFKFYSGSGKILLWEAVLRMYNPEELFLRMSIYDPVGVINDLKDHRGNSTVKQVDKNVYEVSVVNDEKLTRILMKLLMSGGRIYFPSSIEDRVREIIKTRIETTEIMIS